MGTSLKIQEERESGSNSIEKSEALRLGIIGYGKRGEELVASLASRNDQAALNVEIRGVSEVNELRMKRGLAVAGSKAKAYKNYLALLNSDELDAVIIATPDHWHAPMAMDAASKGIHVYLEKCMTRTVDEAKLLRTRIKQSGVVFQLGHQGRQRDLNIKARDLIINDTLGKITLIETTTNRNDPADAWVGDGEKELDRKIVDWEQFQGPAADKKPFSLEHYYGWRNYWAYGTGMSGDLLSNEFDVVNSILDLGIPETAIATGGLYYHEDGREVPDVFQAAFEYPDKALTLLYSGTLASGIPRGTLFMGRDATLEL